MCIYCFLYLLKFEAFSGTQHAKILAMLYAIDVEGLILGRGFCCLVETEDEMGLKMVICWLILHLSARVYLQYLGRGRLDHMLMDHLLVRFFLFGLSFSNLIYVNLVSAYLAWRRGLCSFKAKYLLHTLLGFIRNFAWRSWLLVNQGNTRNKKNPHCFSWTPVMEVCNIFSWNFTIIFFLSFSEVQLWSLDAYRASDKGN